MRTVLAALALFCAAVVNQAQTPVVSKAFAGAKQPQVTIARTGSIFVAFGKDDSIYVTRSTNSAASFQAPTLLGTVQKLALGMRRGPRIVATERGLAVSAISHEEGNLYCWVSCNGEHGNQGCVVNDSPGSAREGLHAMAARGDTVAAVWLDLRTGKTDLRGAISSDGGLTWSKNFLIYRSPDGHICECCHPSLVFGPNGKLFAMWRNWLNGSRDMYLAVSADGGKTFSAARKLGSGTWPLNACPMDGGSLAISPDGSAVAVWRRAKDVFKSSGAAPETLLDHAASQPSIAATKDNIYTVWQRGDALMMRNRNSSSPVILAEHGKYPSVAASGDQVIVVWETGDDNAPIVAKKL